MSTIVRSTTAPPPLVGHIFDQAELGEFVERLAHVAAVAFEPLREVDLDQPLPRMQAPEDDIVLEAWKTFCPVALIRDAEITASFAGVFCVRVEDTGISPDLGGDVRGDWRKAARNGST